MSTNSSLLTPTQSLPGPIQHYPVTPSYVVALSVVAAAIVTILILSILYYCLAERARKRMMMTDQSSSQETEQLREEPASVQQDHNVQLVDNPASFTVLMKPKPSPSIFSRGDFLMEVLDGGVENNSNFSHEDLASEVVNSSTHIIEYDRVSVAMNDLEEARAYNEDPVPTFSHLLTTTPPRESVSMAVFLDNLTPPKHYSSTSSSLNSERVRNCPTTGLQVTELCQADASTAALRGSFSSNQGDYGAGEGGISVNCQEVEICQDPEDRHNMIKERTEHLIGDIINDIVSDIVEKLSVQDLSLKYEHLAPNPDVLSTPAQTIPVNIIPISDQKDCLPSTISAFRLSSSTPSLLHPPVYMQALPLTEKAVSVSHLSLNRSGTYLPTTPLSGSSEYSPVYNMQFGISRRMQEDAEGGGGAW